MTREQLDAVFDVLAAAELWATGAIERFFALYPRWSMDGDVHDGLEAVRAEAVCRFITTTRRERWA